MRGAKIVTAFLSVMALVAFGHGPVRAESEPAQATRTIRVMTYNAGRGVFQADAGNPSRIDEIAAFVKRYDPDVVAFQEVNDGGSPAPGGVVHHPRELGDRLNMNYHFAHRCDPHDGGEQGPLILSKFRIMDDPAPISIPLYSDSDLPCRWAERSLAGVTLDVGGTPLKVFNTHLKAGSENQAQRVIQMRQVLSYLPDTNRPAVLAGDFNVNAPDEPGRTLIGMAAEKGYADSWPIAGQGPALTTQHNRLDYMFTSRAFRPVNGWVPQEPTCTDNGKTGNANWLSDHRPFIMDFEMTTAGAAPAKAPANASAKAPAKAPANAPAKAPAKAPARAPAAPGDAARAAAAAAATRRADVFARGDSNAMVHKWYQSDYGWQGFEDLLGDLGGDSPDAASWEPGRLDVFVEGGTGHRLFHKWYRGCWTGWEDLGGTLDGGPGVASWGPGRLDVFVRGDNAELYHKPYRSGDGWGGWERLEGPANLTSSPDAASRAPGRLDVVAQDRSSRLLHWWYADGQWLSERLPASPYGYYNAPTVASWGPDRLDVFINGGAAGLLHTYYQSGQGWRPWESLGGALIGSPDVTATGPGDLDVFVRGTDDRLHHRYYRSGAGWSAWEGLGGRLTGSPGAVSWNN